MLFNKKLKLIREDKNRLAICCDLRRRLVHIEIQSIICGARRTASNMTLGLAVLEHIMGFVREHSKYNK